MVVFPKTRIANAGRAVTKSNSPPDQTPRRGPHFGLSRRPRKNALFATVCVNVPYAAACEVQRFDIADRPAGAE